jgi:exosortase C (VPDSG-CTERM-specific)
MNDSSAPFAEGECVPDAGLRPRRKTSLVVAGLYFGLLVIGFAPNLVSLVIHAEASELHSYIVLVPFISAYLFFVHRHQLPASFAPSLMPGFLLAAAGFAALAVSQFPGPLIGPLSDNDYFTLTTLAFVCLLLAGGFFFFGSAWMAAVAFPAAFLFFTVPMPDAMANALESASQLASAEAASLFFTLSGTSYLRQGTYFQLPNISIRVAQECSGIRSSWILFITSLLASHLFLRAPWRRALLVAFVIPLGILRNGFRILVIGLLCVHYGPNMINSVVHRRGGPLFFALSLIPLFLLLWWLRRGDHRRAIPDG